ncbi:MAG: MBL fold metallo-hydrolase, partial [Spirochaetes bacterium]|nr:MBL fold metallo-hydrolase [Spirochaetota bacterium]
RLYTVEDAEASMHRFVPVSYGKEVEILPGIKAIFRDAGHILGSAFVELYVHDDGKEQLLVFSGDIGPKNQALIRDPETLHYADVLFIESTYGDRLHKSKEDTYKEFTEIITEAYNRKGNVVIPAFAVERTQEIIFTLGRLFKEGKIPRMPVFIDSPLAISATEIFKMNRDCFDDETMRLILSGDNPLEFDNLHYTRDTADSKRLNEEAKGAIIISASGMCNAGRIKFHLLHNLYRSESSIVFVGYQAEGTLGRQLVDGAKKVRILGEEVIVRAKIHTLGGFSAHADRDGLLEWMSSIQNPNLKVFVVHGEETASISFAKAIQEKLGWDSEVPRWGEIIDLKTGMRSIASYGIPRYTGLLEHEFKELKEVIAILEEKYKKALIHEKHGDEEKIEHQLKDIRRMLQTIADEI